MRRSPQEIWTIHFNLDDYKKNLNINLMHEIFINIKL
jgi:hypothetical protein